MRPSRLALGPLVAALLAPAVVVAPAQAAAARVSSVAWEDAAPSVAAGSLVAAHVTLAPGGRTEVRVVVGGATVRTIPGGCSPSTVIRTRSSIDDARTTLTCDVDAKAALDLRVEVRVAATGPVTLRVEESGAALPAPDRAVTPGTADTPRTLRLLSSPDFLNADVADLRRGPGSWNPKRSANGTGKRYEKALDTVLDDWQAKEPAGVLVAGDMVNGRWGRDTRHTGNFGPVGNAAQRAEAARRAAATYYPQYVERFRDHDLPLYAAPGDHEYGDNPWTVSKRRLAPVFRAAFARWFTRGRFKDHPSGVHAGTAYAFRPSPDVQVVSIDVFDITTKGARIRVDREQLRWLRTVLAKAQADGVQWTIVQGHTPILEPVRARGSSELRYPGGARSALWKAFRTYGVDLYLAGEVHDTTASSRDGIVQLAHGGAFQFALTTYALLDVHPDRLDITLNDFDVRVRDGGRRLWETVRSGLKPDITVKPDPFTIGTLTIGADGSLSGRSGILTPYRSGG